MNFYQRLIAFWNCSKDGSLQTMGGMWQGITQTAQGGLMAAMESGDDQKVMDYLSNLGASEFTGFEHRHTDEWESTGEPVSGGSRLSGHQLLSLLGQRVGVSHIPNPENPTKPTTLPNKQAIESRIGISLNPNLFLGHSGFLKYRGDSIPARFAFYLSAGYTMKAYLGRNPESIIEIGGGIGWMGHIARQWECKTYVEIDLPLVAIIAAYSISRVCGEESVWLYGEKPNPPAFARFYPSTHFREALGCYDVAFNSDSLPEMPKDVMLEYMALIKECVSDGFFLSINHENHERITDAASGMFTTRVRAPFLLRPGYVEEIYVPV